MTDNKLDKLIFEYGMAVAKLITKEPPENVDKARQAIIDYVEGEKRDYYDKGMEKANELWA